jgi:acyl-CoA reductase-like NAD-dependent aldehyde dehydrogenase
MKVINPATEEVINELQEDTKETIDQKYQLVKKGQPQWAKQPVEKRVQCIQNFYELLDKENDDLAKTLTAEVGKPLQESYNELNGARARMKYGIILISLV